MSFSTSKVALWGENGENRLIDGALEACEIAASTMGPGGRPVTVALEAGDTTIDDGYKSMMSYRPADPLARAGGMRAISAAKRTADLAGDASTHTAVLLSAFLTEAKSMVAEGMHPRRVTGILEMVYSTLVKRISYWMVTPQAVGNVAEVKAYLANVCNTAARGHVLSDGRKLGDVLADLVFAIGPRGVFSILPSASIFEAKMTGAFFHAGGVWAGQSLNNQPFKSFENAVVVVVMQDVNRQADLDPIIESWGKHHSAAAKAAGVAPRDYPVQPLVMVVKSLVGDALAASVHLTVRGRKDFGMNPTDEPKTLPFVAIQMPPYATPNFDLAAYCGANVLGLQNGRLLKNIAPSDFGYANVKVMSQYSTFSTLDSSKVSETIEAIQSQLETAVGDEEARLLTRLSNLSGSNGEIKIPKTTERDFERLVEIVDDSLRGGQSFLRSGHLPGGGYSMLHPIAGESTFDSPSLERISTAVWRQIRENLGLSTDDWQNAEVPESLDVALCVSTALDSAWFEARNMIEGRFAVVENVPA